jgi:guanosine-3',5'-bis(diphosphate) 3'-pyrophosphohydrolase
MNNEIDKIIKRSLYPKLIEDAFEFAKEAYKDKYRVSGENYIHHAVRIAASLDKMNLDPTTIAFGLLHDVLDDAPMSTREIDIQAINKKFGKKIGDLIEKISNLSRVRYALEINIKEKKILTRDKLENFFSHCWRHKSNFS